MTNISITNSKNNVGAYINDINLKKLDQSKAEEIKKALNQFGVIFIKKQIKWMTDDARRLDDKNKLSDKLLSNTYWGSITAYKIVLNKIGDTDKDYNNAFNDGKKEAYEEMMKFISEKQ